MDTLFNTLVGAAIIPAILAAMQVFKRGPSQYADLLEIPMCEVAKGSHVNAVLEADLNDKFKCRELLAAVTFWRPTLMKFALVPITVYLIAFVLWVATPALSLSLTSSIEFLWRSAVAFQALYLLGKFISRIPHLLIELHANYSGKSYIFVLIDFTPLWQ